MHSKGTEINRKSNCYTSKPSYFFYLIAVVNAESHVPAGVDLPPLLVRRVPTLRCLPPLAYPPIIIEGGKDMESPSRESSTEPRGEVRSRHRHADVVLRTLSNVVRGNQFVSWQLDHRPLFIAPQRSEIPHPKHSSNQSHPKKASKVVS